MLVDVSESCHLCCLTLTAKVLQPANLSSAAHIESVFMYKGAHVILFSFEPKGTYVYVKVRRSIGLITAGRGTVDINHLLMRFHHHVNLISDGS